MRARAVAVKRRAATLSLGTSEPGIVSDLADDDDSLVAICLRIVLWRSIGNDAREGHWWSVDLRHLQSAQNDLIEWAVRAAREERIELDQQLDVRVIALGHLAVRLLDVVLVEIDTHFAGCVVS